MLSLRRSIKRSIPNLCIKLLRALPQVPTVRETFASIALQAWQCVAAARDTPLSIVERLNTAINRQLELPGVRDTLQRCGVPANPMAVADLNPFVEADEKRRAAAQHLSIGITIGAISQRPVKHLQGNA